MRFLASLTFVCGILFWGPDVFANSLFDATFLAIDQYSRENKIDLDLPCAKLAGFASEKHGGFARARLYDTSSGSDMVERPYACELGDGGAVACWSQKAASPRPFVSTQPAISAREMQQAAKEVAKQISSRGIDGERYSIVKVWQEKTSVHVRLGYEVHAVEMSYVCKSTKNVMQCALATTFPENEP